MARMLLALVASRRAQAAFVSAPVEGAAGSEAAAAAGPYYLLQPSSFATVLGEDLDWASQNIPLFESANATLDLVYYFRWRTVCHPDPTPTPRPHPATLSGCGLTPA